MRVLLILIMCSSIISCNDSTKQEIVSLDYSNEYLFDNQIEEKVKKDNARSRYQISAWDYANKGDYDNAMKQWAKAIHRKAKQYDVSQLKEIETQFIRKSAHEYIVDASKDYRVLIINEEHQDSFDRAFMMSLLKDLYKNGYRNIGFEALVHNEKQDFQLNKRGYPAIKDGFYVKDPNFGELIRSALNLEYYVFPYENTSSGKNSSERDSMQAVNIKKVMDLKPEEKFIIYCGFDHPMEGVHNRWGKAMASQLASMAHIDPLTINQAHYGKRTDSLLGRNVLNALNVDESSVFIKKASNEPVGYRREDGWMDITVFHPGKKFIGGIPDWGELDDKETVKVPLTNVNISTPFMVMAFYEDEDVNSAVPAAIKEADKKTDSICLRLKKGVYKIVIANQTDQTIMFDFKFD